MGDDSLVLFLAGNLDVFQSAMAVAQKVAKVYENLDVFFIVA